MPSSLLQWKKEDKEKLASTIRVWAVGWNSTITKFVSIILIIDCVHIERYWQIVSKFGKYIAVRDRVSSFWVNVWRTIAARRGISITCTVLFMLHINSCSWCKFASTKGIFLIYKTINKIS
jgi:hypothetical protein